VLFLAFVSLVFCSPARNVHHHDLNATAPAIGIDHHDVIDTNETSRDGWALFKQCDARWSGNQLGTCSLTICQAGCAMSSVAMILNSRGVNTNPGSFNAWLKSNGGYASGCDLYWGKADAFGKTTFQSIETASESDICSGVAAGHGVVANVRGGSHWVLITGCRGGGVFNVNDPGFNQNTYTMSDILREAVYH